jgi:cytochrome c biogenesis protein ResB
VITAFKSYVTVIGGTVSMNKTIEVNHPVEYETFRFYQFGYDVNHPHWTCLEAVHDPATMIVYLGFVFLNIGAGLLSLAGWKVEKLES